MFTHPDSNYSVQIDRNAVEVELIASPDCAIASDLIGKSGGPVTLNSFVFRDGLILEERANAAIELLMGAPHIGCHRDRMTPEIARKIERLQVMYVEMECETATEIDHDTDYACESVVGGEATYTRQEDDRPWLTDGWIEQICLYVEELD